MHDNHEQNIREPESLLDTANSGGVEFPGAKNQSNLKKTSNITKIVWLLFGVCVLLVLTIGSFLLLQPSSLKTSSVKKSNIGNQVAAEVTPDIGFVANDIENELVEATKQVSKPNDVVLTGNDISLDVTIKDDLSPAMKAALYAEENSIDLPIKTTEEVGEFESSKVTNDFESGQLQKVLDATSGYNVAIESINGEINLLKKKTQENTDQLIANQNAITQTAQLIVTIKDTIQKTRNELIQVRGLAYDNQDAIKAMEAKINVLSESKAEKTNDKANPAVELVEIKNKSESIVDPFEAQRNGQALRPHEPIYKESGKPKQMVEEKAQANKVTKPAIQQTAPQVSAVTLSKLWVMAVHNNKAVVYDNERQYLLTTGQWYKDLGRVERIDHGQTKVFGRFDNGTEWVIATR